MVYDPTPLPVVCSPMMVLLVYGLRQTIVASLAEAEFLSKYVYMIKI